MTNDDKAVLEHIRHGRALISILSRQSGNLTQAPTPIQQAVTEVVGVCLFNIFAGEDKVTSISNAITAAVMVGYAWGKKQPLPDDIDIKAELLTSRLAHEHAEEKKK
jgi:hypothetical protein